MPNTEEQYTEYARQRTEYSKKILESNSSKKIVMAGPGTGKSFLFQQVAGKYRDEGKENIIVLSFINELVKDLSIDMHGRAEVSTLHSFAAKELKMKQPIHMDLLRVIEEDLETERGEKKSFDTILNNLDPNEPHAIEYLRLRKEYYAHTHPSVMVYDLVQYYTQDHNKIPTYDLILVDEYQDFNLLEVELINLLSTKSDIIIAGDDDQSLYSFKHSVPDNIREKHASEDYEAFELPYCSRSTEVVINAFHDVIGNAKSADYLKSRIEKQYLYFPCKEKDGVSANYPKIIVKKSVQQKQNAFFIDAAISKTFEHEPKFEVLIICSLKSQINSLGSALRKKGYNNITGDDLATDKSSLLSDGLRCLMDDKDSNLGWRLCAEALLDDSIFRDTIKNTSDRSKPYKDVLSAEAKSEIKTLRAACGKIKEHKALTKVQQDLLFEKLDISVTQLGENNVRDRIFSTRSNKVHNGVKIKLTTILGSKGLSYDYVFMVNFDDKYLIKKEVNDECINMFLVAMTRSKKQISIFTSQTKEPKFVGWIDASRKLLA